MEMQTKILTILKVDTQDLCLETIQEVLIVAKRQSLSLQDNKDFWIEVTQTLWQHLQEGLIKYDNQLLCATCFYTVLCLTDKHKTYLQEILKIIREETDLRNKTMKQNAKALQAVSLMYGMFQSSFLTHENVTKNKNLIELLKAIFNLLTLMANEYSKFTYIIFKTINSFKKICGTDLQAVLFSEENKLKLLNIVNHNWENPITGVRDLNKGIFQCLISVMDEKMYGTILQEINGFYWNKSKYLMLAVIVDQIDEVMANVYKYDWVNGLVSSLNKSGLVSAGADMYFALLKKIKSEEEWSRIFMRPLLNLLCGVSENAIDNFCNYWCITTFKLYPALIEMLLKNIENLRNTENKLYCRLCIIKQANKLGLIKKNWDRHWDKDTTKISYLEKTVLEGLEHSNSQIRIKAFDIVCISHYKAMPMKTEYELVLDYVHNNINSDCTVLRISMLKTLNEFLTKIHMSYLNHLKSGDETEILKDFCFKYQEFVIKNIEIGGNYQRKITCIKLAQIFLNSLKEVPKKKQKQIREPYKTIIEMLKNKETWLMSEEKMSLTLVKLLKDPAEDVRESVGQLLLEHYSAELRKTILINNLIEDALKSISSKFFYEINCGRSIFKLIINILLQEEQQEATFRTVNEVFDFALRELITEYQLKRGILNSIEKGKQLHAFIGILQAVLEVSLQQKYSFDISNDSMIDLLNVLEGTSNQFAWEQETDTSSDFSKMSDMVHNLIVTAGYNEDVDNDSTKITGLHQIVLNCLWLNIKASCDLSSLLIQYQNNDLQLNICQRALDIISHALETCRHKGAIEAAGAALGQSIQHLTSLPEGTKISKLAMSFLESKLHELISEAAQMASVTRRGAGLSIMVHRVVSSDIRRGKPLFHYFMKTILDTCKKAEDIPNKMNSVQNIDNEKDLPKAIYIHFLTRIVTDSSLASDMMFYSAELAEIAFDNLTSPYWQIRNAALQLYGALIQKLIGQKKASGPDEEIIATVACDEFRTHSPKLWNYILDQLKCVHFDDKIQCHSNLVPILNMLANIARRYNFLSDILYQKKTNEELLNSLMLLLDSPIHAVRRLTAKSVINIFTLEECYKHLLNNECLSENYIQGSLMLIANMYKLYGSEDEYSIKFNKLKIKYERVLNANEHSYLSKEIFEEIFFDNKVTINNVQQTLDERSMKSRMPGVFVWANKRFRKYLQSASWDMIIELLSIILGQNDCETYCNILLDKIEKECNIPEKIILDMINILLLSNQKFSHCVIWQILYKLLLKIDQSTVKIEVKNISGLYSTLEKNSLVSFQARYMIPLVARISAIRNDQEILFEMSKIIVNLIDPESADVEMRYIAAMANNEFSSEIKYLPEQVKITSIKSAIILLQDEDEDVRLLAAKFYSKATKSNQSLQPYICLFRIFKHSFLHTILNANGIITLQNELKEYLLKLYSKNADEYNPFANDSRNIYLELDIFRQLIESI